MLWIVELLFSVVTMRGSVQFNVYLNSFMSSGFLRALSLLILFEFLLSTLGQGLVTSTYPGEVLFSIAVAILGLLLFALLIGNMQVCI